jgi:hypothetical protein
MTFGPLKRTISQRAPVTGDEAAQHLKKELIPSFLETREVVRAIAAAFGGYTVFVDPVDGKLKVQGPNGGTITTVGVP